MSIREDQPTSQTTGSRNAGGDLQVKDVTIPDSEGRDRSNEAEATEGREAADRPSQ